MAYHHPFRWACSIAAFAVLNSVVTLAANGPTTEDLLQERLTSSWRLDGGWKSERGVYPLTSQPYRRLVATNAAKYDAFASVPVAALKGNWKLSSRIHLFRNPGQMRLALWNNTGLRFLADWVWDVPANETVFEMAWYDGSWHRVYKERRVLQMNSARTAFADLAFDSATQQTTLTFTPENGQFHSGVSTSMSESVMAAITRVGFSCNQSAYSVLEFLLTRDFVVRNPESPAVQFQQLKGGQLLLFWSAEPGVLYRLQDSYDLKSWGGDGTYVGSSPGTFIVQPDDSSQFFRVQAR